MREIRLLNIFVWKGNFIIFH